MSDDTRHRLDGQPVELPGPATRPALLPNLHSPAQSPAPAPLSLAYARAEALQWASRLTVDRHDPLQVLRNAAPALEFLQAARDEDDLHLRRLAGNLQNANDDEITPDDDGAAFALRVAVLYGAMTGAA